MSRGDHLYVSRVGYTHHGIDVGDGRVVHYSGELGKRNSRARFGYATLQEFAQGREVKVREYANRFDADETVERAESKLGEGDQHLFGRNCELFASWCVAGRNTSGQPDAAADLDAFEAATGIEATAGDAEVGVPSVETTPVLVRSVLVRSGTVSDEPGRTWSLRREWSRAFTIMLMLLLAGAVATIVGVRGVVDEVAGTAVRLRHESTSLSALRTELIAHEEIAHKLLIDAPEDRPAFLKQQREISHRFEETAMVFPTTNGMRATVLKAQQSWRKGLTTTGLWGDQLSVLHGDHGAENPNLGALSDVPRELLDSLERPSLDLMDAGLAYGADLERKLIAVLIGMFFMALVVTVYFRRRMVTDLLRPVAAMHDCVLRLQGGDYKQRIAVARRDELGELAQAFNRMADALYDTHLALTRRASHDSLTGLANRAALTERLTASFGSGGERRTRQESLLFIDIDDFKDVNDSKGHEGGDALLVELAARLQGCVRGPDLVARLGGDEFAILVREYDGSGTVAVEVAERVLHALHPPFVVGGENLEVTVSIGVAQRRPETADVAELLRQADFAMYMAKGGGKARYQLFDSEMHDHMVARAALRTSLSEAVATGQLRIEYQPVTSVGTGEVVGVEALVRWQHPTLGLLAPAEFISLAEETGDIDDIGCWVLDTATRQVAGWRQSMAHSAELWVSVNLSAYQLERAESLAAIERILADPVLQADKVVLEITETALAADVDGGIAALNTLKGFGVRVAIDDFGTGFSSLSTLASLPVDILKIDRSFISGHDSGRPSASMLEGILGLANILSLEVVAEGIEEQGQLDLLCRLGCGMGQGFLLARPLPAHEIESLLASGGLLQPGSGAELGAVRRS